MSFVITSKLTKMPHSREELSRWQWSVCEIRTDLWMVDFGEAYLTFDAPPRSSHHIRDCWTITCPSNLCFLYFVEANLSFVVLMHSDVRPFWLALLFENSVLRIWLEAYKPSCWEWPESLVTFNHVNRCFAVPLVAKSSPFWIGPLCITAIMIVLA